MKILVTNDDGVNTTGLHAMVGELKRISEVVIVAPDREQSGIGTALTMRHPLRVKKIPPILKGVETYSVSGTPGDCVIMGISRLAGNVDLVISGINHGPNLGDDVLISGTVGGALQGYLHGVSSIAVSVAGINSLYFNDVAQFTAILASTVIKADIKPAFFLNVNAPDLPASEYAGVKITCPSNSGYAFSVEEGNDGFNEYYWLKYRKSSNHALRNTDAWAIARRQVSVTPLHTYLFGKTQPVFNGQLTGLLDELKRS
ncbi:MAG: 5'/3'-nucleotidase SurE [Dehalococcoidales bacterium]|nr:5'/3'-nucleotidase SurE [Dehalococcoidales bacterium]